MLTILIEPLELTNHQHRDEVERLPHLELKAMSIRLSCTFHTSACARFNFRASAVHALQIKPNNMVLEVIHSRMTSV